MQSNQNNAFSSVTNPPFRLQASSSTSHKRKAATEHDTSIPLAPLKRHITDEQIVRHLDNMHISKQFCTHQLAEDSGATTTNTTSTTFAIAAAAAAAADAFPPHATSSSSSSNTASSTWPWPTTADNSIGSGSSPPSTSSSSSSPYSWRTRNGNNSLSSAAAANQHHYELQRKLRNAQRITLCDEMRDFEPEALLPPALVRRIGERAPCTALVLWQPPQYIHRGIGMAPAASQPQVVDDDDDGGDVVAEANNDVDVDGDDDKTVTCDSACSMDVEFL